MPRDVIQTEKAPKAIGPYSQAIQVTTAHPTPSPQGALASKTLYCSGQIPLDPATGDMVQGDVSVQTERVMKNLEAVLAAAGMNFSNVVRCGIFLIDLGDFAKVNEVYAKYFPSNPPARATVQVSALPRGSKVEIDCIAAV